MTFTPRAARAETPEPVRTAVADALGASIVGHPVSFDGATVTGLPGDLMLV